MPFRFEPVSLQLKEEYARRLKRCTQIASDYSVVNQWAWGREHGLEWALDGDLVWIRQTRPRALWWAPVGEWVHTDWRSRLATPAREGAVFTRVPEGLLECWQRDWPGAFTAREAREHWDYLYSVPELIGLSGKKFHKKKNLLNQFRKNYSHTYHEMDADSIVKALAMQEDWCTWRDCESSDTLAAENRAITRVFEQWEQLGALQGGLISVDGDIAAFTVGEELTDEMLLIHFEKGLPQYKGVYQAINQMFLQTMSTVALVNREQDLGDEGLRKAKLSYNPSGFVRKYEVEFST